MGYLNEMSGRNENKNDEPTLQSKSTIFKKKNFLSRNKRNNRNNRNKRFQEILFMAIRRQSLNNYMLTIKHELPCNIHIIQVSGVPPGSLNQRSTVEEKADFLK